MTPSELKHNYQQNNPDGHFFDHKTMKFFGDTMKNYGCRVVTSETGRKLYELHRKRMTKHGQKSSVYFDAFNFSIVKDGH